MAFGIFIHKADGNFDDIPSKKYQFPKRYLNQARQCEGDWIVYLEPRRANNARGYFAVAKVQKIIPDPNAQHQNMFLAIIEPGTYLDFGDPVPFQDDGHVIEQGLLNNQGQLAGRKQLSIRTLSPQDFARIIERGLGHDHEAVPGFSDTPQSHLHDPKDRIRHLTTRTARDHNFRKAVLRAYGDRCAITGFQCINGGGNAEAEAAHIRPVEHNGPDIVGNGIALSKTVHWMFDRGLLGLGDDLTIMVSRQSNDPDAIRSMINKDGVLLKPQRLSEYPLPEFVAWHRENRFKQ